MKTELLTQEKKEEIQVRWSIALSIPGWIALKGGIDMLLHMARSFANDTKYMSLIANWIPWAAVLFFVTGWFIAHNIEIALFQKRIRMARVLAFSFLFGIMIISLALSNVVVHPVFHELLDYVFLPMVISGYFFRWSMFHKEPLRLLPGIIFWEKLESQ